MVILRLLFFLLPLFLLGQARPVSIIQTENGYQLQRNDTPYFVKGAGGSDYMDKLAEYGGNSIRTWDTGDHSKALLDSAAKYGLTVTLGLWVGHERHGFNYNDAEAVRGQLEQFTHWVTTYKDHPALLAWGVGNEVEINYSNLNVWDAIGDIADMIDSVDGQHPSMVVFAEAGCEKITEVMERAPSIDILGINSYGGLSSSLSTTEACGWTGPLMVTEWGPNGYWEVPSTDWGAPIEQTSSEKAATYYDRYENVIETEPNCLGSYVFYWGQKQERTSTWFGLFLETGEETEVIDVMIEQWSGNQAANEAPRIQPIEVNGMRANNSVIITNDAGNYATVKAMDPDGDELEYEWLIAPESNAGSVGGDPESTIPSIPGLITEDFGDSIRFLAPENYENYRLYVFIRDQNNHAAYANIPFRTELGPLESSDPAVLFAARDAYLQDGDDSDENKGLSDPFRLLSRKASEGFNRKVLIGFDISSINQDIDECILSVYGQSGEAVDVAVTGLPYDFRWYEQQMSWEDIDSSLFQVSLDTAYLAAGEDGYVRWNVGSHVERARQRGFESVTFMLSNLNETSNTVRWNPRELRMDPPKLAFSFTNSEGFVLPVRQTEKALIYPVPADQTLQIKTHVVSDILIFNLSGIEVYQQSKIRDLEIDISGWPAGIYFYELRSPTQPTRPGRIIVAR